MSFSLNGFKAWYASLGVWGGIGTVAVGVLSLVHVATQSGDAAAIDNWVQALIIVISGVLSLWGRIRATRKIAGPLAPPSSGGPTRPLLLALALAGVGLMAAGCQSQAQVTTTQRLTQIEQGYRVALDTLANARDAGFLTQAQLDATKPERQAVDAALDAAEAAQAKGDPTAAQTALDAAAAALGHLQPILDQVAGRKAAGP